MALAEQVALRSSSTGTTIAVDAAVQAGDVAILSQLASNNIFGGVPAAVTPTGFTSPATTTQTFSSVGIRVMLSFKLLDGSEAGGTLTGMNGSAADFKRLLIFRDADGPVVLLTSGMTWNQPAGGTGAPSAQTVTSSGKTAPQALVIGQNSADGGTNFTGSGTFDGTITDGTSQLLTGWAILGAATDFTVDANDGGNFNTLMSGYLNVTLGGQPAVKRGAGVPHMGARRAPAGGRVWAPAFLRRASGLLIPSHQLVSA